MREVGDDQDGRVRHATRGARSTGARPGRGRVGREGGRANMLGAVVSAAALSVLAAPTPGGATPSGRHDRRRAIARATPRRPQA
jgi:hypothetical protein